MLMAGALLVLILGVGTFTMYSVERTMLEEQRQNGLNAVSLATLTVMDRSNMLFRNKTNQAVNLKGRMEALEEILGGLSTLTSDQLHLLKAFPLPNGVSLMALDRSLKVVLKRGDAAGIDFYAQNDIKGRPVGETMLRLTQKRLPATCVLSTETRGSFYGRHLFFEEDGLLIGLWMNIEQLEAAQAALFQAAKEDLQNSFSKIPLGPSGFLFVVDGQGVPVIGPNTVQNAPDPQRQKRLLERIQEASHMPNGAVSVDAALVLGDAEPREGLLLARYVKPLNWYVCGLAYMDEARAPGQKLSLSLVAGMLVVTAFVLLLSIVLIGRLTAPLSRIAGYARRLPEQDFMRDVPTSPLLLGLSDEKQTAEVAELARSFIFMDKTLRQRVRELMDAAVSRQRLEGELNAATEIQMGFLPKPLPPEVSANRFTLAASLVPAREVGGDLYDFFMLDKSHLCFVIGDVAGKGVPASLFMSMTLTLIRSWAADLPSPEALMTAVNENLSRDNPKDMFVTLFIGVLNLDTGELLYANGGHNPPLMLRHDGEVAWLEGVSGLVVGAMEGIPYTLLRTAMHPDDVLLLYTDGLNEAMNERNEEYSNEAMFRAFKGTPSREPYRVIQHMLGDVAVHVSGAPASDDMTILCLQYIGPHAMKG